MTTSEPLSLVSLFSGGGGLDLGLEAAGFETLYASDIDHFSCVTLANGKKVSIEQGLPFLANALIEEADVCDLSGAEVLARIGKERGEVDLLAGGPPCQAFSVFGKRAGTADPRGQLPEQYRRLLTEIAPRAFVFENVYGLLTIENGEVFRNICESLSSPGQGLEYKLSVFRLNAANYGVPQKRDRVFIVGDRAGRSLGAIPAVSTLDGIEGMVPARTVSQGLRGLPEEGSKLAHNHRGRKHSQRIIERYAGLAFGERDPKTRINKLDPSKPSYAIIVGSDKGGGKGHVHPVEPREVTARESARMQTFPDWWEFFGSVRHPIRQVGNAVPPVLAACIGKVISERLFDKPAPTFPALVQSLGQSHLFSAEELELLDAWADMRVSAPV
jgi:DNA (cytosine-5)-methyltransferase 1